MRSSDESGGVTASTAARDAGGGQETLSESSSVKSLSQTGTQTSPDEATAIKGAPMKGHFSIGAGQATVPAAAAESPRAARKTDRAYKGRGSKKSAPPSTPTSTPSSAPTLGPTSAHSPVGIIGFRERHRKFCSS